MRTRAVLALLTAGLVACGDGGTDPDVGAPGIRVVEGEGTTDTIGARQAQPLVVEVRDDRGRLRQGVRVVFVGLPRTEPAGSFDVTMLVRDSLDRAAVFNSVFTDRSGRARLRVTFGPHAGEGRVEVGVVEAGASTPSSRDTARFTVLPGAPASVVAEPVDTVVAVGGRAHLRGSVRDRAGNVRGDAVQWRVISGAASVAGGEVSVTGAGFARVEARHEGRADTVIVVGAPAGTLSGFLAPFNTSSIALVLFDVDGTHRRTVLQGSPATLGTEEWVPYWSAATPSVYFNVASRIWVSDTLGNARRLLPDGTPVAQQYRPTASRDGAWVYFYGNGDGLWRVRADGTGTESIATGRAGLDIDIHPEPSPDGSRLVFVSARGGNPHALFVLDLSSGVVRPLGVNGFMPRWSPTGERIAYFDAARDELRVVNVDGTNDRSLGRSLGYPFSWSPDGRWIVGRGDNPAFMLIDVATSERVKVPGTQGLSSPAWVR